MQVSLGKGGESARQEEVVRASRAIGRSPGKARLQEAQGRECVQKEGMNDQQEGKLPRGQLEQNHKYSLDVAIWG